MSETSISPSELGPAAVAYYLTVSILTGQEYSKGRGSAGGVPIIDGCSRDEILRTYALCRQVVHQPSYVDEFLKESS
ncbi:MAG: hypothetical protein K5799_12560 [Erythrobacter sp.]|nr:hypothetical protein [Erythrobacter sp.]